MTAVFFVMGFDIAPIVIWIFELPLDQEISSVSVIRILLGFERGLVVVAIAEDRSGYVVGVKVHASLNYTAGSRKAIAIPVDLKLRQRGSDILTWHTFGGYTGPTLAEVGSDSGTQDFTCERSEARRSGLSLPSFCRDGRAVRRESPKANG